MPSSSLHPAAGEKTKSKAKQIPNPRRLLILSPASHSQSTIPSLLHSLTGVPVSTPPQATTSRLDSAAAERTESRQDGEERISSSTEVEEEGQVVTTTFAGYTTHAPFRIQTKYYTAEVPIWVDEVPLSTTTTVASSETAYPTSTQWKSEFLGPDARVVRDVIGAVVICLQNPEAPSAAIPPEAGSPAPGSVSERDDVRELKDLIEVIGEVKGRIEEERGGMGEVPGLLVLVGGRKEKKRKENNGEEEGGAEEEVFGAAWWEEELYDMGVMEFEVVEWDPREDEKEERRNQFGEFEGMRRIKEVLETHDWTTSSDSAVHDDSLLTDGLSSLDDGEDGFNLEVNELEREMLGLRFAIEKGGGDGDEDEDEDEDGDDDDQELKVEGLETLMMRMQAIKDMSTELPEHERKTFAAKAVRDIMKEL